MVWSQKSKSESDFARQIAAKWVSVPNFQRHLVRQVNWKYCNANKAMSLLRLSFAWCGSTISLLPWSLSVRGEVRLLDLCMALYGNLECVFHHTLVT